MASPDIAAPKLTSDTNEKLGFQERKPPLKIASSALLFMLLLLIGITYVIYQNADKPEIKDPSSKGSKVKVGEKFTLQQFASEDEYKEYLKSYENQRNAQDGYGVPLMKQTAPSVNSAVPVPSTTGALEDSSLGGGGGPGRVSETNVQVLGIDEPDIVKTDGENIFLSSEYYLYNYDLGRKYEGGYEINPAEGYSREKTQIIKAFPPEALSKITDIETAGELLLSQDTLLVFSGVNLLAFDVSNPQEPQKQWQLNFEESQEIVTSRLFNDKLYLVARKFVSSYDPCPIPLLEGAEALNISCTDIYYPDVTTAVSDSTYTVLQVDIATGKVKQKVSFVGNGYDSVVYMSPQAFYITYNMIDSYNEVTLDFYATKLNDLIPAELVKRIQEIKGLNISATAKMVEVNYELNNYRNSLSADSSLEFENNLTNRLVDYLKERVRDLVRSGIVRVTIEDFKVTASVIVPGSPLNQFSLDEYDGYLRYATSANAWSFGSENSTNDVYILDQTLKVVGQVQDLGLSESIYSVRFIKERGYVVTYRQIDPFYVLDLSNPQNPQLKGELKIPGYSSYLHPLGQERILGIGEEGRNVKVSLFNVTNASEPLEVSKYALDEYWSEVSQTHHAFLLDEEKEIFFIPGSKGGYIFTYAKDNLSLVKAVSASGVRRALYLDDYLYLVGDREITIWDENTWDKVNELTL